MVLTSGVAVAVAQLVRDDARLLVWSGVLAASGYLVVLALDLARAGVALQTLALRALASADPAYLQFEVYRVAFVAGGAGRARARIFDTARWQRSSSRPCSR